MSSPPPSPNGSSGERGPSGRFAKGNPGGPGNPHAAKVARLRSALLRAISSADMRAVVDRLVEDAKAGNVAAAREIMERTLGKPIAEDILERIERLETLLKEHRDGME